MVTRNQKTRQGFTPELEPRVLDRFKASLYYLETLFEPFLPRCRNDTYRSILGEVVRSRVLREHREYYNQSKI